MIEYSLNGAWGKEVPSDELAKVLENFGVTLTVEQRKDGLSNVKICIDDEKILQPEQKKENAWQKFLGKISKKSSK